MRLVSLSRHQSHDHQQRAAQERPGSVHKRDIKARIGDVAIGSGTWVLGGQDGADRVEGRIAVGGAEQAYVHEQRV